MKKYTVEWLGAQTGDSILHTIEAENNRDAFDAAAKNYKYPSHPRIEVSGGFFDKIEVFDNPHYGEPRKADAETIGESRLQQSAPTDSSTRQPITSIDSPQSSGWATLYRVCGGIILVIGFIGTIAVAQKDEEAGFQLAVMAIALTLTSFLIDVLTDMREYLKRMAEKQ